MIYLQHCSTLWLIFMPTIQLLATPPIIWRHRMISRTASRRILMLNWSADNKMILNETKTKSMLVTGKRLAKKMEQSTLQLHVNSTELEQVSSHKLLGVTIDSQLTFDQHVENLCTKLSQRIAALRKIRRFLPLDQRKLYYNAMIKQTMLYASTVWTSCSVENMHKVFKLQKRVARVILGADTKANSVQLF